MALYRKKPVTVAAVQWTGDNLGEINALVPFDADPWPIERRPGIEKLLVHTSEGTIGASVGDWIIRGVKGEFYPCKPDVFELTYELAES